MSGCSGSVVSTLGLEVNADGSVNAVVWTDAGTYLVLDTSNDRVSPPTPMLDAGLEAGFGRVLNPALRTQSDGTLLWSSELWGRYCRP